MLHGKVGGHQPPFFMTVTITVDGEAITNDWQAQQTSNPMDEVDLFKLSDDLTDSTPTSAPHPDPDPEPDPDKRKKGK